MKAFHIIVAIDPIHALSGTIVRWGGNSEGKSQGIRWNSAMTEGNSEGNSEGIRGNSGMKTGNSGFETGKMHWLLLDFGL